MTPAANLKIPRQTLLAFAVVPLLLIGTGCGQEDGFAAEPGAETPDAVDLRPAVETSSILPGLLTDVLEISGRLEPRSEVMVSSELGGAVEEVRFDKGDRVEKGALLARVGSDLLRAALAEAEAELEGAELDYTQAKLLVEREASPKQDFLGAEVNRKRFVARVESARLRLSRSEILAPASGVIVQRDIEPGEVLGPGSPVAVLHDTSVLRATIGIPETDIAFFAVGSPAEIAMDAYPDRSFEGRISYIAPSATRPGRNFQAEVEVANPDGALRSGLIVRTRLQRRVFADAVVVARDALVERDGFLYAFVLDDGMAQLRAVTLGPDEGDQVVITAGLEVGETLITDGHRNLLDGQPVRVVSQRD
ncbi:MAG: efflux RND transporter periplasmic adaptor subunit [Acidobacteria bacterium]|nr:efflux RND transporter periplasmic adaptor subunit [Acidobacteriota bacterium]MYG74775.1 efflux RND transporter periplasmic adaptor subunit [Acidobacteriota bacterium]